MPTEAQLTRSFLKQIKSRYPKAVAFKFNDRTTSGIPDSAVVLAGVTIWIEFKRDKPALTDLQRLTLGRLHAANNGRAVVIVFTKTGIDIFDYQSPLATGLSTDDAITYLVGLTLTLPARSEWDGDGY